MPRPMMFFVSVILFMPLGIVLVTAQTSLAEPASDLPKIPDLDAREPMTIGNNSTEAREPPEAREEMPLIRPVLTEAKHAELQDPAPETAPMPVFLVGALMVLLCAGAIFKLAR